MTSYGIEFVGFIQPTINKFTMAMPYELMYA